MLSPRAGRGQFPAGSPRHTFAHLRSPSDASNKRPTRRSRDFRARRPDLRGRSAASVGWSHDDVLEPAGLRLRESNAHSAHRTFRHSRHSLRTGDGVLHLVRRPGRLRDTDVLWRGVPRPRRHVHRGRSLSAPRLLLWRLHVSRVAKVATAAGRSAASLTVIIQRAMALAVRDGKVTSIFKRDPRSPSGAPDVSTCRII